MDKKLFNYIEQRVVFNVSESDMEHTNSRVHLCSVLGPPVFSIYINDLCDITLSYGVK